MITDKLFERILIGHGIFPPSVMDPRYGDNAEMTKDQLIEKTVADMSRYWWWDEATDSNEGAGYLALVIAELDRTLPDGVIKTCGAFRHLNAGCYDSDRDVDCHNHFRPLRKPRSV